MSQSPLRLRHASLDALLGWLLIVAVKLGAVAGFHLWSLSRGRRGLGAVVLGGDDGDLYLFMAERYADTGFFPYQDVYYLWAHVGGAIMAVTGWRGTLPFKGLLLLATLASVWAGLTLLRRLSADTLGRRPTPRAEVLVGAALVLFPSTLWVSSYSVYRDAALYALALMAGLALYEVLVRRNWVWLAPAAASLGLLFEFRWYAAVALGTGALLWLVFVGGARRNWLVRVLGLGAGVTVMVLAIRNGLFETLQANIEMREYFEQTGAGSNIGVSYVQAPVWAWPGLYVYSLVSNVIGPLPHQIRGGTTAAGFVLEVPLLGYVLWRVARSPLRRRPEVLLLLLMAATWFALVAIYNDNLGTALRLRVLGFQFLFLVAILDRMAGRSLPTPARPRARRRRARRPALAASG